MNSTPSRSSIGWLSQKARGLSFFGRRALAVWLGIVWLGSAGAVRGEAMLELFQMSWTQISQKLPEIAEAGYDSLWVPNPAKGNSGTYSVGYDTFDPFDLGGTNQQGTVATRYGTQDQLIQMVQLAHRFGIRVYFDNVMNHRSSSVPGNYGNPTNYYPGLIPQDFHLQVISGGSARAILGTNLDRRSLRRGQTAVCDCPALNYSNGNDSYYAGANRRAPDVRRRV